MTDDSKVYEALCGCFLRELSKESPNPKIVECAVKFVKDQDISTMPGSNQDAQALKDALPFKTGS